MYKKVSTNLNFVDREKETEKFWDDNHIFEKSMENRKEGPTYTFYDGPPTANGKPHIGHVLTRVIKDMIPRYRTMKGYMVPRKAGWDTHGLPVELEVEKLLGLNGKEQIEEYGMEPFIKKCKESVWKYKGMWEDFSGTVGFWADMENPYVTYDDNFIESEWWALKTIWDKKLLYKGFKIVPYCPRCGTPLSSQEVAQGYKAVKERSAIVRFKVVGEDAYFLAWTTTPWTLPSNVALCVNPNDTYCKVKAADGYTYYMAEALLDTVLGKLATEDEKAYEVLETMKGADLENKEYEPLYDCAKAIADKQRKKGFFVTCDTYVTMSDGTGIVHIAPAFGEDDANVGRNYDLPFVQLVNDKGELTEDTPYAGLFVKDADPKVLVDLDKRGQLFDAPKFEHDYPHCWRCDTPLIYYARESWFIKMTEVKDKLVANNNTVNWIPKSIGEGRFGNWLENVQDWGISRNRYWGTPLNIWECCDCGCQESIGSRAELAERSGNPDNANVELHRPYIDEVTFKCKECGGTMKRVPEVIDCWFDSGSTHFASMQKDQGFWPATVYLEGLDQYRGWFQSSLLTAVGALGKGAPFKECVTHGWTVDGEGKAMHKSLGNGVDPADVFKKYGADICRLWAGSADYHVDVRCSDEIFKQLSQNYLKFRNTAKFCLDNLTDFDPNQLTAPADMEALDRWAITKLNELLVKCEAAYQNYEFLTVSHAVNDFCVVTLSSLYLDIIKDRLYCDGADSAARRSAQSALWIILDAMTKVFAPILAFTCDEIWLQMPHRNGDDGRNVLLNQMSKPYADYALSDTEMAVWETALRVRSDVNGVLETARADKRIGKSLEAHVALIAGDEDAKAALDAVKSVDLPEIFIVSNVSTNETAPAEGAVVGQGVNFPGLSVAVTEAKGTRCPRCWMHSESPDEHGLCPRCAAVCKALGVVFE